MEVKQKTATDLISEIKEYISFYRTKGAEPSLVIIHPQHFILIACYLVDDVRLITSDMELHIDNVKLYASENIDFTEIIVK